MFYINGGVYFGEKKPLHLWGLFWKEIEYNGIKYVLNDELIAELLEIIESDKQSLEVE